VVEGAGGGVGLGDLLGGVWEAAMVVRWPVAVVVDGLDGGDVRGREGFGEVVGCLEKGGGGEGGGGRFLLRVGRGGVARWGWVRVV